MSECKHTSFRRLGAERCFVASVATPHITDDNPAAHGNIEVTERCNGCGAVRKVNVNGRHHEYGAFGESHGAAKRRERDANSAAIEARGKVGELTILCDGQRYTLALDADGMFDAPPGLDSEGIGAAISEQGARGASWLTRAKRFRALLLRARAIAAHNVSKYEEGRF